MRRQLSAAVLEAEVELERRAELAGAAEVPLERLQSADPRPEDTLVGAASSAQDRLDLRSKKYTKERIHHMPTHHNGLSFICNVM